MIYDLMGSTGYKLTKAARINEQGIEAALEEHGLTRIMWSTLVSVGVNSLSQPSRIADFLGTDRPSVSRALRKLEAIGYVERHSMKSDGRQVSVQISKTGADTLRLAATEVRACNERFFSRLSEEEVSALRTVLDKLNVDHSPIHQI